MYRTMAITMLLLAVMAHAGVAVAESAESEYANDTTVTIPDPVHRTIHIREPVNSVNISGAYNLSCADVGVNNSTDIVHEIVQEQDPVLNVTCQIPPVYVTIENCTMNITELIGDLIPADAENIVMYRELNESRDNITVKKITITENSSLDRSDIPVSIDGTDATVIDVGNGSIQTTTASNTTNWAARPSSTYVAADVAVTHEAINGTIHWTLEVQGITVTYTTPVPIDATLNICATDGNGSSMDADVRIYRMNNGTRELIADHASPVGCQKNHNYTIELTTPAGCLCIRDLNVTSDIDFSPRIITPENYTGAKPSGIAGMSNIIALNTSSFNFTDATLIIPRNGLDIDRIIHYTDWNFSNGSASNWEPATYSDYDENETHFWFTVTGFDAYAAVDDPVDLIVTGNITFPGLADNQSEVTETGIDVIKEGESLNVTVEIYNAGPDDLAAGSGNYTLFFDGSTYTDETRCFANVSLPSIPANTSGYVTAYWTPSIIGTHNISVSVRNRAGILDTDLSNNNESKLMNVSAWQKYHGNVSGNIALADSASRSLHGWTWNNETDAGYVYIVNAGVNINWSALHALGCDKNNALNTSGQDFLDADTNLGMTAGSNNATGFVNNNITELFSSNPGSATNTTSFTVHGNHISNVPVVNSTDMTDHTDAENANFITGILWDDTKDTNGYYDTGDSEDLVFIANVRTAAAGLGGAYRNYEIAAPCALNPATDGDLDFYVELK